MDDAPEPSTGNNQTAVSRRLSNASRCKLQNKLTDEAFLRRIRHGPRNNAAAVSTEEPGLSTDVPSGIEAYDFHRALEETRSLSSSESWREEAPDDHAATHLRPSSQQQQQSEFQQRMQMQQHQQALANLEYLHRLPKDPAWSQEEQSLKASIPVKRAWLSQEQRANEQFMSSVPPPAQQPPANVQFMSSLPSYPSVAKAELRPVGSNSTDNDIEIPTEHSRAQYLPFTETGHHPFNVQPQSAVANFHYLSGLPPPPRPPLLPSQQQRMQTNVQFLSSLPHEELQSLAVQRDRHHMEPQGMALTASLLPSRSTTTNAMHPSAPSFNIDRGHEPPTSGSLHQPLEASSTSIPLDPEDMIDYSAMKPGTGSARRMNMHFANVAFLGQLERSRREASAREVSVKPSEGPIHDYETFKQQGGLPNIHFFHNLAGHSDLPDKQFSDFGVEHDTLPGATSGFPDHEGYLEQTPIHGLNAFKDTATKVLADQLVSQISATPHLNTPFYDHFNVDHDGADMEHNLSVANAHLFYGVDSDQVSSIASLAMDRRHPQSKPSTSTTFVYPSLLDSTTSIRLLQIDPVARSDTDDGIYCTLEAAEPWISDMQYECMSYCWGMPTGGKRIFVQKDGGQYRPMEVTDNLYGALEGLRNSSKPTLYWIDAICIDQTNDTERGEQVSLMKDIYSKASGVTVWLGPSTQRLAAAVEIISDIAKRFLHDTTISSDSIVNPLGLSCTEEDTTHLQSYNEYAYEDVAHFFALPWFRRVWVLQEALAQTTITVRIGKHSLPWGSVILAALWQAQFTRSYTAKSTSVASGPDAHQFLPELWLGLLHTRVPRGLSMIELASRAREFQSTDPRDKVFALLGLANDVGSLDTRPSGLVPDYSKTTVEVYTDFAKSIILQTCKLDVLSMVNTFPSSTGMQGFVSWMPNLDASVATIRGFGFPNKYNASYSTDVDVAATSSNVNELHKLKLSGHAIDTAHEITTEILFFTRDLKLYLGHNTDAITQLWRNFIRPTTPESENQRLHAFIELLTAAGFALPTEFPAQPLGKVVASRHVPSIIADFAAYWARLDSEFRDFSDELGGELKEHAKRGDADQFGVLAGKACHERKFFITDAGRIGLCPQRTSSRDRIVVLYGGTVPYVLRATSKEEWKFVGECYVDGVMFGEARDLREREEVFCIV